MDLLFGIIFDMDGVLVNSEALYQLAWKKALENAGYPIPISIVESFSGRDFRYAKEQLKLAFGQDFPFDDVFQKRRDIWATLAQDSNLLKPHVKQLLDYLVANEIQISLATSNLRYDTLNILKKTHIYTYFNIIVTSEDVTASKPEPDIFLKAAQIMNISPEKLFVVEDSEAGIMAAHKANMKPILIPDFTTISPEVKKLTYREFTNLVSFQEFLDKRINPKSQLIPPTP